MFSPRPDVDAFLRQIVAAPEDHLPRLVFADWLEETGDPADAAWAEYIRLRAAAPTVDSALLRGVLNDWIATATCHVLFRLTLTAAQFVPYFHEYLSLLPARNFTLRMADFSIPRPIFGWESERIALDRVGLPLRKTGGVTLIGLPNPFDLRSVHAVERVLGPVIAVHVPRDEIGETAERILRPVRVRVAVPPPTPRPPSVWQLLAGARTFDDAQVVVDRVIDECRSMGSTEVHIYPYRSTEGAIVHMIEYRIAGSQDKRYWTAHPVGRHLVQAFSILSDANDLIQTTERFTPFGRAVRVAIPAPNPPA